jgi:hypothetical protein
MFTINSLFGNGGPLLAAANSVIKPSIAEPEYPVVSNRSQSEEVNADESSDYYSLSSEESDESDSDEIAGGRRIREEKERELVLQAAGLIVTQEAEQPPELARSRSIRRRRPPPSAPQRAFAVTTTTTKDLPPVPEPDPVDSVIRLDDAFDRYEAFRLARGNVNRISVASFDSGPPSPGLSVSPSLSRDSESRSHSTLLNFLGRKSPTTDPDRRGIPHISAPIMINPTSPSRENSPAFGSVCITNLLLRVSELSYVIQSWASLVDRTVLDDIPSEERRRQEVFRYFSDQKNINLDSKSTDHIRADHHGGSICERSSVDS